MNGLRSWRRLARSYFVQPSLVFWPQQAGPSSSLGCRRTRASELLDDALAELRGGDVGGAAVAKSVEEALLEAQLIAAVVAAGEMSAHRGELLLIELEVEEDVEPLDAVVAVHRALPNSSEASARPRCRARAPGRKAASGGTFDPGAAATSRFRSGLRPSRRSPYRRSPRRREGRWCGTSRAAPPARRSLRYRRRC